MLIIADPSAAAKVTIQPCLRKHQYTRDYMDILAGPLNMVTMEGKEWKQWRGIFNPGFSSGHLMSLVPEMVSDTVLFTQILLKHASTGKIFQLENAGTKLTIDIIGKVVLDMPLNVQTSENELVLAFRDQLRWLPVPNDVNIFRRYNPLKSIMQRINTRIMNDYLEKRLQERFAIRRQQEKTKFVKRSKPIIDLALDSYLDETNQAASAGLPSTFTRFAIDQFKVFLFAGHDTTSSTMCYIAHLLSQYPGALQKLRQEHDEVYGVDTSRTATMISEDPHSLNRIPYTMAVIKETLRLYPPASSVRLGDPDVVIDQDGKQYPTDGFMVWPSVYAMHHAPELWPEPEKFVPERFLSKEGDPLFPVKGAWRPFEHGPRNCVGQELAFIELKIYVVLTFRDFDLHAAYEEQDKLNGKDNSADNLAGDRAYQVLIATAKPKDGFPAKVFKRFH